MTDATLLTLDLPGIRKLKSGKVREVFDLGDSLLIVATDRISAFDCISPMGFPAKERFSPSFPTSGSTKPPGLSRTTDWPDLKILYRRN